MKIKKGLLILLFVLLFAVIAPAATNDIKRVFISESFVISTTPDFPDTSDTLMKQFLFFFCDGSIVNSDVGTAIFIFSDAKIGENVTGTFYSIFSELRLETINAGLAVKTFFSKVFMPLGNSGDSPGLIQQIFGWTGVFGKSYTEDNQNVYNDTVDPMLFKLLKELAIVGLFSLFFAIRKSFFEQGALAVKHEYGRIIKSGLAAYTLVLCGIVVFLMTVFGIVFSILLALATIIIVLIGCAALYLFIGGLIAEKTGLQRNIYIEMIIGLIAVELASAIPYAKIAVYAVIIPIVALGVVYTSLMNMYVNKNFYESPYAIG